MEKRFLTFHIKKITNDPCGVLNFIIDFSLRLIYEWVFSALLFNPFYEVCDLEIYTCIL